jgi:ABC-2 type transport system ATP-binding protein
MVKIITREGIKARVEGPLVVVELEREEQYDIIRDAVIEADATLRRLAPRRHGLADIFRGTQE